MSQVSSQEQRRSDVIVLSRTSKSVLNPLRKCLLSKDGQFSINVLPDLAHPTLHHSVGVVDDSYMLIQYLNLHKRFLNFLCYF